MTSYFFTWKTLFKMADKERTHNNVGPFRVTLNHFHRLKRDLEQNYVRKSLFYSHVK